MIRFGDGIGFVPTLLEDDAGELRNWLRRYLPVAVADMFVRPPAERELALSATNGRVLSVPTPNWPPMPEARFNRLYWPTGATRWAHCFLLADTETKDRMLKFVDDDADNGHTGILQIAPNGWENVRANTGFNVDKNGVILVSCRMYMLPPRRIVSEYLESEELADKASDGLWIVPLVDERYFWQHQHVPNGYNPQTWSQAFTDILDELGAEYDAPADFAAGYGTPTDLSPLEFHNAAIALDALAFTTGRRIVRAIDGTVKVQKVSEADSGLERNRDHTDAEFQRISGGDDDRLSLAVPDTILLSFPAGSYDVTSRAENGNNVAATHVVHAALDGDDDDAFTTSFSADWFGWLTERYHESFAGLKKWEPCGYDDAIEWCIGSKLDGESQAITRVRSLPYNWGMTTLLRFGEAAASPDDGFPPGTGGCPCECFEGVSLPDADAMTDVCCYGHPLRKIVQPWYDAAYQGELELKYIGGNQWATDAWDGPSCEVADVTVNNTFQYVMTPSATPGESLLELVVVDDNGCTVPCLQFLCADAYQCNCVNVFARAKFEDIDSSRVACNVCDKPAFEPLLEGCAGAFASHTAITDYIVTVDGDEFCLHGPYDGGDDIDPHSSTIIHKCIWTGQNVAGQYGMLVYTSFDAPSLDNYLWQFLLCDEPFSRPEGSPFYGCPPDGPTAVWSAAGGVSGLLDGVGTYDAAGSTLPATITVAEADSACEPYSPGAASRDGSCAGCTSGAPPTNALGHCCYRGGCYEWSESLCNDFGGEWDGATDCSGDVTCSTSGACCDNGVCFQTNDYACSLIGGFFIEGGNCNTADICEMGACCRSGNCTLETEAECAVGGGLFAGVGTNCSTIDCRGSCCVSTVGGGTEDCGSDSDCACVSVDSQVACFALPGSDNSKAYSIDPCFTRVCECAAGSETCDNNPA